MISQLYRLSWHFEHCSVLSVLEFGFDSDLGIFSEKNLSGLYNMLWSYSFKGGALPSVAWFIGDFKAFSLKRKWVVAPGLSCARGCETPLRVLVSYIGPAQTQLHVYHTSVVLGPSVLGQDRPCCEVIWWWFLTKVLLTFLWSVPKAETLGFSIPCSLMRGVCRVRRKIRAGAGECLVPPVEAAWKRCSERTRGACLIPLCFSLCSLGWAIFPIFSWGDWESWNNDLAWL